jgi:L-asparaginase II
MALAYARLAESLEPAPVAIRDAMIRHPDLVAGEKRFCTDLMRAMGGTVLAKIGAAGIYCAALLNAGIGIALKIEDGDMQSAPIALLAALRQLLARGTLAGHRVPDSIIDAWAELPVHSTRGAVVGAMRSTGSLRFFGAPT